MARSSRKSLNPYKFLSDDPDKRVVPHKKRHCSGISETHRGESVVEPLLNLDTCIVCEVTDQWVTRCSGIECVISFHQACLYPPDFDSSSSSSSKHVQNPHCPFCWLRILTGKSKTLREKVVVADKAVFKYLDKDMKSRDENITLPGDRYGIQEHSVDGEDIGSDQVLQGEKDAHLTKETQLQVEKGFVKSRRENMPLTDLTNQPEEDLFDNSISRDENTTLPGDRYGNQEHSVDGADTVSHQELLGEKDAYLTKDKQLQVEKGFGNSRRENMQLIDLTNQPEEDIMNLEVDTDEVMDDVGGSDDEVIVLSKHFQDAEICKDKKKARDQTQVRKGAGEKGYVSQYLSMQQLCSGKEICKDNEKAKDQTQVRKAARKKGYVSQYLSMKELCSEKEHDQVQQNEKPRRRRLIMETPSIESSSEQNGEHVTEQVTSSNQVTSPSNQMGEPKATTKVVAKSKTVRDISSLLKKEPRKKLPWTILEEEMLKEGVEKFAAIKNKNMPWRKILEMGEKVFDETRTPSDLKDKWRRMVAAIEGKKPNKTARNVVH